MSDSFSALYSDYKKNIMSLMAGNEFYEHLYQVAETGENNFSLFNRYFEKKIDLRWVDAIEECIVPLDTIIRNPRKFIVQEEEIVPIERARKITAESVRHLAQHTSMIARVDGDRVTPSKILNVFREESFEIYENRFIFTLLRNLQRFIDTRYNVLFSMSDDENMSSMKMDSTYHNGSEEISFKVEIAIKQGREVHSEKEIEQNPKNASALARIERIKRIINEFAHSSFMRDLQNCTPVRPPIMRTNVISKDPNFRACLTLWQFISSYDEIGYEIFTKESNDMISDEYKEDMFRMFTSNYMLLKKNFVPESAFESSKLKKRKIKPKLLKRLAEELVMDYDLEEIEIRKVFVDEMKRVAKKKAAGEQKIHDAVARALTSENERKKEIEDRIKAEIQRKKEIEKRKKEREAARIAKEKAAEKARIAREKAIAKAKKEKEIALAKEKARKEREKARIAREKAKEAERIAKEKEALRIKREKERVEKLRLQEEQRKAKLLAKEKAKKEREAALIKEKMEREKARKAQALAKQRAIEAEKKKALHDKEMAKRALERQKERERIAKEKAAVQAKERAEKAKQKEKERAAKEKAALAEKKRIAREKQIEKERIAKQKAALAEKERKEREKQKQKERAAKERAALAEKQRLAREKQKRKEAAAKARAREQAKTKKSKAPAKNPAAEEKPEGEN